MNKSNYSVGFLICLGLFLLFSLFSCATSLNKGGDIATSEVKAREIAFAKTMADRDFETFLTFISPEVVFFNGNEPLRGHKAISKAWAPFFEGETAPFSWHPDVVEVLDSGRLALSSGPVRRPSGETAGRFNSIWRKDKDGQWRVIFDKGS